MPPARTTLHREALSAAALAAVVADAGYTMSEPAVDDDGIDWTVSARSVGGVVLSPKLDVQLKSTSQLAVPSDDGGRLSYSLEQKDYDRLILTGYATPRVLVLMVQPSLDRRWVEVSHDHVAAHHGLYWLSLRGKPPNDNDQRTTVHVPTSQRLGTAALRRLMQTVADGGAP